MDFVCIYNFFFLSSISSRALIFFIWLINNFLFYYIFWTNFLLFGNNLFMQYCRSFISSLNFHVKISLYCLIKQVILLYIPTLLRYKYNIVGVSSHKSHIVFDSRTSSNKMIKNNCFITIVHSLWLWSFNGILKKKKNFIEKFYRS